MIFKVPEFRQPLNRDPDQKECLSLRHIMLSNKKRLHRQPYCSNRFSKSTCLWAAREELTLQRK